LLALTEVQVFHATKACLSLDVTKVKHDMRRLSVDEKDITNKTEQLCISWKYT